MDMHLVTVIAIVQVGHGPQLKVAQLGLKEPRRSREPAKRTPWVRVYIHTHNHMDMYAFIYSCHTI